MIYHLPHLHALARGIAITALSLAGAIAIFAALLTWRCWPRPEPDPYDAAFGDHPHRYHPETKEDDYA